MTCTARGPGRKEQRRLPRAIGICDNTAPRHLLGSARAQGDGCDLRIQWDEGNVRQQGIVLPGHLDLTLSREIAWLGVAEREHSAAVDGEIEHAVGAAQRLAEFGMRQDGERDPGRAAPQPA
jgi:hypothetical protein